MVGSIILKSQLEGLHRLDAEFFQPTYIEIEKILLGLKQSSRWGNIDGRFITGPFGSEFIVDNYSDTRKYRYVRGKDVKKYFLEDDDNVYIPEKDFNRLKKYALQQGDILVSVVGTNGNTVIVDKSVPPAIFSSKSSVFRSTAINPFYFIAFLNSRYGQQQLERSVRGALQTGLNIDDLRSILVYMPRQQEQEEIGKLVEDAKNKYDNSTGLYHQAESLLLEALGLKENIVKEDLTFVVNHSETKKDERVDAEYFQPNFERLMKSIQQNGAKELGNLVTIKKGFEPGSDEYFEEGKLFIRVSSLSKFGITEKDQKYLSEEMYKKLRDDFEPKIGEILLTKDATPGVAYTLKEPIHGIISGGILRLQPKSDIESEYVALCINSLVGQMQANRDAGGSVIAHWKPEQIKEVLIPILPRATREKLSRFVIASFDEQKKSKELIEETKRKVEEMIESQSK